GQVPDRAAAAEPLADALAAGCDDPLVRWAAARFSDASASDADFRSDQQLFAALPAMTASPHPPFLKYAATRSVQRALDADDPEQPKLRMQAEVLFVEAASWPGYVADERRAVFAYLWRDLQDWPEVTWRRVCAALDERVAAVPGADAWLAHMLFGMRQSREAWDRFMAARLRRQLQDEPDYVEFLAQVRSAADRLEAAHALAPNRPEAASELIRLEKALAKNEFRDSPQRIASRCRRWFEVAIAAQFDHLDAWHQMHLALIPLWGGSYEQQWALAHEALDIGRFDTDVSVRFRMTVDSLSSRKD
ncbi:unnamed protein product, partial [Ectocarpus fasciculatus]